MIPKKPKVIAKQVSEDLDIDQVLVDDLTDFFYKEVRTTLSSLEQLRINLPGLGVFQMRKTSVVKMIKKYDRICKKYGTDTFTNYHNKKLAEEKLEKLLKAKEKIDQLLEEKKKFKDGRKNLGSLDK
jgi:hypothetical protein